MGDDGHAMMKETPDNTVYIGLLLIVATIPLCDLRTFMN